MENKLKEKNAFSIWSLVFGKEENKTPNAKRQTQTGITLIALIITVIVLLILAGTAISISINGGDLFGRSQNAVAQYNNRVAEEEKKINEVWSILNTISDGNGGGDPVGLTVPTELAPGDTVTWTPNGKYTQWKANYYSDGDTIDKVLYSGNTAQNESVTTTTSWDTTSGNHNIDMTISSWKVLDVSSDRKTVRLVPSAPTTAGVKLRGAQGYNNAVKLLNDACDALYGGVAGSADGITARSISMIDLEGSSGNGTDGLMSADTSKVSTAKGTDFPVRVSSAYTPANSKYPKIYEEEEYSVINLDPNITNKIGMSATASATANENGFITRTLNENAYRKGNNRNKYTAIKNILLSKQCRFCSSFGVSFGHKKRFNITKWFKYTCLLGGFALRWCVCWRLQFRCSLCVQWRSVPLRYVLFEWRH